MTFVGGGMSYVTHPKCWSGQKIPLCQSFNIVTYSTC